MSRLWRWFLWLALMLLAAIQIARTSVVTDVSSFLPGPADDRQRLLIHQLRDGISTRLVVVALRVPDGMASDATRAALEAASRRLHERLAGQPGVAWVSNGDPATIEHEQQRLFEWRYLLSPGVTAERFSANGLVDAFARLERELTSSVAVSVRPIARSDPTLESLELAQAAGARTASLARGPWLGAQGHAALLLLETSTRGFEIEALRTLLATLRAHADAALADWPASLVRPTIEFAGPAYFGLLAHDALGADAERLSLLAVALVAVLLWWTLRSPRLIGIAALPVLTGALAGFAVVGALKGSIHGITLAFGVTLIGEAVDYAIYTYVQRRDDGSHAPGFWRQIGLASATSLIGFAAMFFSGFQGLQQLGLFSIVGLVAAAACTRWLFPDLLAGTPAISPSRFERLPRLLVRMRLLRWPLLIVGLLSLSGLLARQSSVWLDSLDSLSAGTPAEVARDARYRDDLALPDLRTMVAVSGADAEAALRAAERVSEVLDASVRSGTIVGYESAARLLPSQALQRQRQAVLPPAPVLRERVSQATSHGNLRADAFEPFIDAVERSRGRAPLTQNDYAGSLVGHWLASQIVTGPAGTTVLMNLHLRGSSAELAASLSRAGLPQAVVIDLKGDVERLVAGYRQQAMRAALIGSLGILVLLAVQVRRRLAVAAMALSLVVTVAITAAAIALLQGHLTVFNLVSLLLVVGVTSNYTLFFSTLSADPATRDRSSLSVMLAGASTFIAFAMLVFSRTPVLSQIGATVSLGAALGVLSSMAFAPKPARTVSRP